MWSFLHVRTFQSLLRILSQLILTLILWRQKQWESAAASPMQIRLDAQQSTELRISILNTSITWQVKLTIIENHSTQKPKKLSMILKILTQQNSLLSILKLELFLRKSKFILVIIQTITEEPLVSKCSPKTEMA